MSAQARVFYGWWIAAASGLGLACGIATIVAATFSVFVGPLREEFGWSPGATFSAVLVVAVVTAVLAPAAGALVDRRGAKHVVLFSFAAEAVILASFYFQSGSLFAFYVRYALLGLLGLGTTHVAFARIISMWFDRRRGLALGLALAGIGVGGILWPIGCQWLIGRFGWREAYVAQGLIIALIALPAMALVLRDAPQSMGLQPDGAAPAQQPPTAAVTVKDRARTAGATLGEALQTPRYWLMLGAFTVMGFVVQSVMLHLVPLLRGRGVAPMLAALAQSSLFLALVLGRLTTGWLMDRYFAPRVGAAFLVAPVAGIAMLALGAGGPVSLLAAMLVGLAAGAEVDVLAYLTGRYYGLAFFSTIYGTFYGLYSLGGGLGGPVTAWLVESLGSYERALWVHVVLLAAAGAALLRLGPFPVRQPDT